MNIAAEMVIFSGDITVDTKNGSTIVINSLLFILCTGSELFIAVGIINIEIDLIKSDSRIEEYTVIIASSFCS
ncbi:hypothetical protein [Candidatus Regiella insecticola]|uniref:hypothetical protein n=1 Tax=Candidatus Regiella insecticola TaxID=138073 RepID=UPI0005C49022|nr:hypothetical protein [Candidatus Regiella insecticola]